MSFSPLEGLLEPILDPKIKRGKTWKHITKDLGRVLINAGFGRMSALRENRTRRDGDDPPPLKWSDLRYVFDIQEDCNGKEAIQA